MRGRFITFTLEDPDDVEVLGSTFQAVVADLLIDLFEDDESDEVLEEIARLFEFRHFTRLLRELSKRSEAEDSVDDESWRKRLLKSCDKRA